MPNHQNDPTHQGIIAWFARNSVAANLLMTFILVAGLFSYLHINKRMFPDFEANKISVSVPFLGAAPEEVEEGVVVKVEQAIQDIDGIKRVDSFASEGLGQITIEVNNDYNLSEVMNEVKMKVDAISTFPELTEKPVISKQQFQSQVLWLSVYGNMDRRTRQLLAQQVRDEIAALPEVNEVSVVGNRAFEIAIEVSQKTLREYGLSMSEVANAIRNSSLDVPGGTIKTRGGDIRVRTKGQAYTGDQFAQIILRTNPDGTRLKLGDVAHINDGFVESDAFALFNGKPTSSIQVKSVGDQDDLSIAKAVKAYVAKKQKTLPQGAQLAVWGDSSYYLNARLSMMFRNMIQGAVLVLITLALFLRIRLALWVMLGIPISFLGAFLVMPNLGEWSVTINLLSLFAFILVLGIIVDDAIVIGESVYTTIKADGHSTRNVILGAQKVAMPATFGVLTTIAAFVPVLFVDVGHVAVFFRSIALVVSLCLVFSLIESKLILPAHLSHMKFEPYNEATANRFSRFQHFFRQGLEHFIHHRYRRWLEGAIRNRYITMASFFGALFLVLGLLMGGFVKTEVFPNVPSDFIRANLIMNDGTAVAKRNQVIMEITSAANAVNAEYAKKHPQTGGFLKHSMVFTKGDTGGGIFLELTKPEKRNLNAYEIEKLWRDRVGDIAGTKELRFFAGTNAGGGAPLQFELSGTNYAELDRAAADLEKKLEEYDGVFDIRNSYSGGTTEIQLSIRPKAELLGLTQAELGRQVRRAFYGEEAQRIQRGRDEVKVMVRYPKDERRSIADLEDMRIRTPAGVEVPFYEVANVKMGRSYSTISRVNRKRAITVSADLDTNKVESRTIINEISKQFIPTLLKKYSRVSYGLEGASKDQQTLMLGFFYAFVMAMFLIYALLAIPLKSYAQPIIVMSAIPFGFIGAVLGHLIFGRTLNMMSGFGIIALTGVVVNDSLIMVDFVNRARAEGVQIFDAVIQAGTQRFRAILLTSLTTFFGLMPIYFETSLQAQFVIPMAISLGVGIMFATVITLFLIPALYLILEDFKSWFQRNFRHHDQPLQAPDPEPQQ